MRSQANELKDMFRQGDLLTKLIFINCGVFLLVALVNMVSYLFQWGFSISEYLAMPAQIEALAFRLWTIVTYMFLHEQFLHFICNLLMLYWTGRLFLGATYTYNQRDLVNVYILGGLFGGAFYLLCYNIFPAFNTSLYFTRLEGASASVMALLVAAATTQPEAQVRLTFVGDVKLKWLALVLFLLNVLPGFADNAGGCIAHIGGGAAGYLFATYRKKGKDIAGWIGKTIDCLMHGWDNVCNFFCSLKDRSRGSKKPKFKVVYGNTNQTGTTDAEYNMRKKADAAEIDAILDKIKVSGYASLTAEEKQKLFSASGK